MDAFGCDIASQILLKHALAETNATAAGSGDATLITGSTLDLTALAQRPRSVCFAIPCEATLAATKTLVVTGSIETSADGSNWDVEVATATLLTLTGQTGGSTEKGFAKVGCTLAKKDVKYVRVKATPDLNASGTDTAKIGAGVAIFGGLDSYPSS